MIRFVMELSAPIKVLLLNNFGFNVGFYMLLPYLAKHITENLGLAAGFAGFIMGLRMFSQQGLFLVGGTLADRLDYQSVIMTGCGLRVLGFALFGVVAHPLGIVCAAFMSGFAGALFTPAYQALMARLTEGDPNREKIYAFQNATSQAGAFLGPLIGLMMLRRSFAFLSLASAAMFFILLVLQWHYLPRMKGTEHASTLSIREDWMAVFRRRNFILFCLAMAAYYVMFNQIYILLPLSTPNDESVAAIFSLIAVLGVVLQMPVSAIATRLLSRSARLGLGMAVMAISFPVLGLKLGAAGEIPVAPLASATLLSLGMLVVFPPAISMVPELGGERHQGVCYGVFYLFAGIAGASGGGLSAWLWNSNASLLLWGLAGVGVAFALFLWRLTRTMEANPETGF